MKFFSALSSTLWFVSIIPALVLILPTLLSLKGPEICQNIEITFQSDEFKPPLLLDKLS